jgi:hypothetical protein
MLYNRVSSRRKEEKGDNESKFRKYLESKILKAHETEDNETDDTSNNQSMSRAHMLKEIRGKWRSERDKRIIEKEMIEDPEQKISDLLDSFNNITEETSQLIEIKDIIDELEIINEVQTEQIKVSTKFDIALGNLDIIERLSMNQFMGLLEHQSWETRSLIDKAKDTLEAVFAQNFFLQLAH